MAAISSMKVKESLAAQGWYLSSEGLTKCQEACRETTIPETTKNIIKIALDRDIRSVGGQSLPADIARNITTEVKGPVVVQIQRLKNVAVPSTKQHLPSANRRMLRLQITDGHEYVSAIESDGAIDKLSPMTPPGTKICLKGTLVVANGFILLTKSAVEVLGGSVESLLKKWNLNKGIGDINRDRTGTTSGPPPFVPLQDYNARKPANRTAIKKTRDETKQNVKPQTLEPDKPSRELMDKPMEKDQKKPDRKPEVHAPPPRAPPTRTSEPARGRRRGRLDDDDDDESNDYQPTTRPKNDYQLADFFAKKLAISDSAPTNPNTRTEEEETIPQSYASKDNGSFGDRNHRPRNQQHGGRGGQRYSRQSGGHQDGERYSRQSGGHQDGERYSRPSRGHQDGERYSRQSRGHQDGRQNMTEGQSKPSRDTWNPSSDRTQSFHDGRQPNQRHHQHHDHPPLRERQEGSYRRDHEHKPVPRDTSNTKDRHPQSRSEGTQEHQRQNSSRRGHGQQNSRDRGRRDRPQSNTGEQFSSHGRSGPREAEDEGGDWGWLSGASNSVPCSARKQNFS